MLNRRSLRNWTGVLGFCWLLLVIVYYFISHKPFTPEIAINLSTIIWRAIIALVIWCFAGGLGYKLIGDTRVPPLEGFSIQVALGLGIFGSIWLLIGATVGFGFIQGTTFGLILLTVLLKDILAWGKQLAELRFAWNKSGRFGKLLGAEILIILLASLMIATSPPIKFDALVYHLRLPHLYIENGRFIYVPEIMFWGMPQIGEMLFTWAISIGGDSAAAIVSWLSGLTALIGLFGLIRARLGLPAAWSGPAALLAGFTLAISLSWAYVDWFVILFGTALLIGLHLWLSQQTTRLLLISGLFGGMALATKYTAGILIIAGTVIVFFGVLQKKNFIEALQSVFIFWAAGTLIILPWLVKNYVATGSPVYPFFIPAGAMDQFRLYNYQGGQPWGNWLDTILLPWRATSVGVEGAPGYSASIGPLLLGLSLWAWLGFDKYSSEAQGFLKNTAIFLLPGVIVWMIFGRFSSYLLQSRLYVGIFPAIAVLAGAGFQGFSGQRLSSVRLGRIAAILILFVLGLTVFEVGSVALRQGSLLYATGLMNRQEYLQKNLGMYSLAIDEINHLPEGSRVLFLWETRSLGCVRECDPDEILDRWAHDFSLYPGIQVVVDAWKKQGYTHLLYYQYGADYIKKEDIRYDETDWASLDTLKAELVELSVLGNVYQIYAIP